MLKVINAIVATLFLCSHCHSQEVECQNGRCDVIRKAAAVVASPVVVASQVVESTREALVSVANRVEAKPVVVSMCSYPKPVTKQVKIFSRLRLMRR
jgi:hypothetical protein